ncbi:MAG: ATP-binding cassette domain-containing protein [Candidatus Bathyarchaeota archaeon]|nr:MAG: ATP-binding cassette domain-containing protein [Candidatus Bathyarchaeota archaeon]
MIQAYSCAERFGTPFCAQRLPETLSGGERQRVATIRSLANTLKVILADEPTSSLDNENSCMHQARAIFNYCSLVTTVATMQSPSLWQIMHSFGIGVFLGRLARYPNSWRHPEKIFSSRALAFSFFTSASAIGSSPLSFSG